MKGDEGRGTRDGGSGGREAGGEGTNDPGPRPFASVMRAEGMAAPAALARAIEAALGADAVSVTAARGAEASGAWNRTASKPIAEAETLIRAAERVLERVLASECDSRDSALDLLTVDALMTRAMAIAAEDADALATFPELAMLRIASK